MSSDSPDSTLAPPAPPELSALDTRIDELRNRFPFIDTFKQSDRSRHYIVQDLDQDASSPNPYFFLKQCLFKDEAEFRHAFDYYKKYQHYCRGPFAKGDIIRLHQIYFAEDALSHYFELALVMDIGEPDRIDIEHIQPEQITKFLRTVCSLLEDVKKQEGIYHGNISLKNIVLMSGELKISGFRPVFLGPDVPKTWKTELCARWSHFRADLYMIGLLWLRFLGAKTEELTEAAPAFDQLHASVRKTLAETPAEKQVTIVDHLLDVERHPDLTLEEVIRQFEEWLVLDHYHSRAEQQGGILNVFDLDTGSQSDRNSIGNRAQSRLESATDNPFLQTMNQSEEERVTLKDDDPTVKFKNNNDFLKIDGEFTLQDDDSIMLQTANKSSEGLQPVGRTISNDRKGSDILQKGFFDGLNANLVSSEKRLSTLHERPEEDKDTVNSLRNIKSELEGYGLGQAGSRKDGKGRMSTADRNSHWSENTNYMKIEEDTSGTHLTKTLPDHDDNGSELSLDANIDLKEGRPAGHSLSPDAPADSKRNTQLSSRLPGDLRGSQRSNPVPVYPSSERKDWVNPVSSFPPKVELSEQQIEQIEEETVLKFLDDRESVQKEAVEAIMTIQEKHEAAARHSERLMEKIQELGEKKLALKKGKDAVPAISRDASGKSDGKAKAAPTQGQAKQDKKPPTGSKADKTDPGLPRKAKDTKEAAVVLPKPTMALPISQKPKNTQYGILNDPKKPFGMSTVRERDQLFSYTHDMQNKNISFKKMLKKVEPQPRTPGKGVEERATTRLVSAEPPKSPPPTLEGMVADNDLQKKTVLNAQDNSRTISELRTHLNLPSFPHSLALLADLADQPSQPSQEETPDASPAVETLNNLEMAHLHSENPSDLEKKVDFALHESRLPEAIHLITQSPDQLTSNPSIALRLLTKLYHHLKRSGPKSARRTLLYDLLDLLSRHPPLDDTHSLQQELALELAHLEAEDGHLEHSLRLLRTNLFDHGIIDPDAYYTLLGDAFVGLHDDRNAAASFQKLLNERIADSFVHFDVTRLFALTFRVFQLLDRSGSHVQLARFFLRMLAALQDIKRVNQVLNLKDNDYQNLLEIYVLNTLRFAREVGNVNLTNFVLHEAVSKNLLDFENNMNDEERGSLVRLITDFCGHLARLVNFGGFRDDYLAYLDLARAVLKASELTPDSLRRQLSVNFALAVHHLRAEEFPAAQSVVDKCIGSYFAFFQRPDPAMFEVLFDLGDHLVRKGRFAESKFYFQKVLDLNCPDDGLRTHCLKELAKAEFRTAAFGPTVARVEVFLDNHFEKSEASSYWKYLTLLAVAAIKSEPKKLEPFAAELSTRMTEPGGRVFGFYLRTFKALQSIFVDHHEFKENARHLAPIEAVAKGPPLALADCPRLLASFADLFFKYVDPRPAGTTDAGRSFLRDFVDPFLTVTENAHLLLHFLLNVTLAFLTLVPTFKERQFNHDHRQRLFAAFQANVPKEVLVHFLNESIKKTNFEQLESRDHLNASKLVASAVLTQSRVLEKNPSADLLASVTKDPAACTCRAAFNGSAELQKLSRDFLRKIKESLFKDQFQDVLAYYSRFETSMREKGVSFQKFDFIQQLITFHLATLQKGGIDRPRLEALLSQLLSPASLLCWHDLKLVVLVLESFKDPQYLRLLVAFLDAHHPNYARLVFNDVFLNSFNRKFERLVAELFRQLQDNRFAAVEGHFFVPHLSFAELGRAALTADFAPFSRLRYDVLYEEALLPAFNRHVNFDEIVKFYLRFHLFHGLRDALEGSPATANETLRKFKNGLLGLLIRLRVEESHVVDLLYHTLLLARVSTFEFPDEMCDSFLKIVQFLLDRYNVRMNYQFSRVLTELGKVFFRTGDYRAALRAFMTSGTLLDDANNVHPYEPSYVAAVSREVHVFDTQVFLVASLVEQKSFNNALIYLQRLDNVKTEVETLKLDRRVLGVMVDLGFKKTAQALKVIFAELSRLPSLPLTDLQKKLYVAVLDKLSLWAVQQTERTQQELKDSETKARTSTLDLYK